MNTMHTMTCERFQSRLAELVTDERPAPDSAGERQELAAHAERCDACRGAGDLLALLDEPAAERDRRDDPGEAYWASFDQRLSDRLAGAPRPVAGPPARRAPTWWFAAAAVLTLIALGSWLAQRAPTAVGVETAPAVAGAVEPPAAPTDLPPIEELSWVAGWGGPWEPAADGDAALFPELSTLDDDARAELLAWLATEDAS